MDDLPLLHFFCVCRTAGAWACVEQDLGCCVDVRYLCPMDAVASSPLEDMLLRLAQFLPVPSFFLRFSRLSCYHIVHGVARSTAVYRRVP